MAQLIAKTLVVTLLSTTLPAVLLATAEQGIRAVPRITIDELKVLMEKDAVLILDVRDAESFAKGRIPGAVNVDYTQVLKQAGRFAGERRAIVAYCACANEMTAARASVDLAAKGVAGAKALKGGWDEWVQRGERIER
ncbi:MAG TPA: rhodanese-like domain-containing protein [Vicinamibacterales bacterium]|nr:rhodanese-like domain-containing protein [Vicinamibacterales bacterium]